MHAKVDANFKANWLVARHLEHATAQGVAKGVDVGLWLPWHITVTHLWCKVEAQDEHQ